MFNLLFGSFYPLTQIYQIESDRERGDRTLVSALGVPRALNLSLGLGLLAVACLLIACQSWQAPLLPLIVVLGYWLMLVGLWRVRAGRMSPAHHESWMYIALVVWALIDVVILVTRYLDKLT